MIEVKELNQFVYDLKPLHRDCPHLIYTPEPFADVDQWLHPLLGYPMCPLIGRYNKGEYRIGEIVLHLQFICKYQQGQGYSCGNRKVSLPGYLEHQLRNIPEVIAYNKPKNLKNEPDVHLIHHTPQPVIKLNWIISFGQIGKDFLNYLNHCYIFDESVFYGDKLNRTTCNIPIIAYMPPSSGLCEEEVQRGISVTEWRSEYMSIHLKGGAPAFSPNNMRVGVFGMKKVVTRENNQKKGQQKKQKGNQRKQKVRYKQKKEDIVNEKKSIVQEEVSTEEFWKEMLSQDKSEQDSLPDVKKDKEGSQKADKEETKKHKFIHFYTSVLLEKDHRVNYHWHIEDPNMQDTIREMIKSAGTIEDLIGLYRGIFGQDALIEQLGRLLVI